MLAKKVLCGVIGAGALLLSTTSLANAQGTDRDIVVDNGNKAVIDSRGNCVRTIWQKGQDDCDSGAKEVKVLKEEKQETVTVASPARQLTKEQKVVYFDFDVAQLDSEAKANLDKLASTLKASSDVRNAHIVGYTDIIGNEGYNQKLSERRAEAVRNYMAERGYLNTQVAKVRALGKTDEFAKCDNMKRKEKITCMRPNRRVEVELEFIE